MYEGELRKAKDAAIGQMREDARALGADVSSVSTSTTNTSAAAIGPCSWSPPTVPRSGCADWHPSASPTAVRRRRRWRMYEAR